MSKVCFISNVGSRDIYIEGLLPNNQKTREITEDVLNNLSKYEKQISLPMIEKNIKLILEREEKIDKIFLICTDQDDVKYQNTDTLYSAQIIREIIKKRYPEQRIEGENFQIIPLGQKDFRLHPITTSPQDFDTMIDTYSEILNKNPFFNTMDKYYVSVVSGTQAMNMALILNALETFSSKVDFLYVSEQDKKSHQLSLAEIILGRNKKKEFISFVEKYQYFSAKIIIQDLYLDEKPSKIISSLVDYAHYRLSYDFKNAVLAVDDAIKISKGHTKSMLLTLQNEVSEPELDWQLAELIHNAQIKLQNGEYADFLGRIFNFGENIGKLIVKEKLDFKINDNDTISNDTWSKYPFLMDELQSKYKSEFDNKRQLNRDSCEKILQIFTEKNIADFNEEMALIKDISKLAQLRNHSIIAHKFKGISKQDLDQVYNGDDIFNIVENTLCKLYKMALPDRDFCDSSFDKINALILQNLE